MKIQDTNNYTEYYSIIVDRKKYIARTIINKIINILYDIISNYTQLINNIIPQLYVNIKYNWDHINVPYKEIFWYKCGIIDFDMI